MSGHRRRIILAIALLLLIGVVIAGCQPQEPPNIVLIISDDQRYDSMDYMPQTQATIFDEGVTFDHAYITTPLCCPSRATILTGMYAHHTGVRQNNDPLELPTFVDALHENGYITGLVGKYLNSWDGSPRPEFDFWVSFRGGGVRYIDPQLNVEGEWDVHSGYITYLLRNYAVGYIEEAAQHDRPFLLIFAPNAPHPPTIPAPGDEQLFLDTPPFDAPNRNEADVSDKPAWIQEIPPDTDEERANQDASRIRYIQTLHSLDEAVGDIMQALADSGELDNTIVIFLSDNGRFWGEHRLGYKRFVYEPSVHVPLGIRYPRLIRQPHTDSHVVANIDLAPTFYELAGLPIPAGVDGLSLAPLLRSANASFDRDHILLEAWPQPPAELPHPYKAIHTGQYVYVETEGYTAEFYDLEVDPYQLENQIDNPAYAEIIAELQADLQAMTADID